MTLLFRAAAMVLIFGVGPAVGAKAKTPPETVVKISSDGRDLEIERAPDRKAIRVPVLARCGDPAIGMPRIQDVRSASETVFVTYGKHCLATVALETLAVACVGCD